MPYSYNKYKNKIKELLINHLTTPILDVGPGCGTYYDLFKIKMDCIEIHEPYIDKFKLRDKYENVFIGNVMDFNIGNYKFIIMGDVFEHLSIEDAKNLLNKINSYNIKTLIAVPYNYEQGVYDNNTYEIHLQPDLTPEIMNLRYPSLTLIMGDNQYGYYVNFKI